MMRLYRIDWELQDGSLQYQYVLGDKKLGRVIFEGMNDEEPMTPLFINTLYWSWRAFQICRRNTISIHKNLTTREGRG